ncbi:MAG: hypothetical protein MR741_01005 [Clostridiales bacterium]|nr:hypothetical protein [Clostridiales bacterium]MCI7530589.1 hypothetical protein [Christensenellaceae bacterium]MDD7055150.1 hypothetical protein [Clostridiales bacterium]MDY5189739.1 hypothetical protein [Eubacteriales bacterium]
MSIFIEVITILWKTIWGMFTAIGTAIWENLPAILEIKKIAGYFTPAGMIALYLGVPTVVITVILSIAKRMINY